jgi:hypothetical protein
LFNNDKKLDPQSHSLFDKVLNQITSKNKQKRKKTKDEEFSSFSNKLIEDRSVKSDSFNKNANKSDKNISFEAKEYNTHNSKNYNEPIIQIENKKNSFRTIAAIEEGPEFKKDIDLNCTQNIFEFSRLNQNNETYVNFFDGEGDYSMINNFNLMDKENKIPYKTVSKQGNYSYVYFYILDPMPTTLLYLLRPICVYLTTLVTKPTVTLNPGAKYRPVWNFWSALGC